jgi:lysozyme
VNRLHRLLIRHEGFVSKPYEDTTGNITIGVGRNLDSVGLSRDEVLYLLNNDIERCDRELRHNFRWYLTLCRVRQDAIINLCFNLGITKLLTFKKALAAMEQEDFELAAEEFLDSKWAKQVGPTRSEDIAYMVSSGRYP